jgi:hypothetical protein
VSLVRSDLLGLPEVFRVNAGGTLTLSGGLLSASETDLSATNVIIQIGGTFTSGGAELVKLSGGSSLTTTTFIGQTGGSLTSSGVLLVVDGTGGASTATIAGDGVLVCCGATLTTAGAYKVTGGSTLTFTTPGSSAVAVDGGGVAATLNTTSAPTPLLEVTSSTLTLPGKVLDVRFGGNATLAGPVLKATFSTLSFTDTTPVIRVQGGAQPATLNATGTAALVEVTGGTLSLGNQSLLTVDGVATMTIAGPLLLANSPTLITSATMVVIGNGTLNGPSSGAPLLDLWSITNTGLPAIVSVGPGGTLNSAGPVLDFRSSTLGFTSDPAIIVDGGTLNTGDLLTQDFGTTTTFTSLIGLSAGASVTIAAGDSAVTVFGGTLRVDTLVDAANSTLTVAAGNLLCAGCLCPNCGAASTVIVDGPMLRLTGGATVTTNGGALNGNFHGALISASDASLVLVTGAAVEFSGAGNTVTVNNPAVAPSETIAGIPVLRTNGGFISLGPNTITGAGTFTVGAARSSRTARAR